MAILYAAATYADFKTFVSSEGFKGDIFYSDVPETAQNMAFQFGVTAIDVGRRIIITFSAQNANTDQKPPTFNADFPSAIQLTGLPAITFVGD